MTLHDTVVCEISCEPASPYRPFCGGIQAAVALKFLLENWGGLGPSVPANEAKVPAILMVVEGVLIDFQLSVLVTSTHIAQTLAVVPNHDIEIIICCIAIVKTAFLRSQDV